MPAMAFPQNALASAPSPLVSFSASNYTAESTSWTNTGTSGVNGVVSIGGMTIETSPARGVVFNGKEVSNSDRVESSIGPTTSLSAISVEMWVKLADNGSTQSASGSMLFSWDQGSGVSNYNIYHRSDRLGFNTFNSELYGINSSALNESWQHLVFVMTNSGVDSTQKIFVNGASQSLSCQVGTCGRSRSFSSTGNFILMDNNRDQNNWNARGSIGLMRVYGQELTSSQVAGLYDETKNDGYLNNVIAQGPDAAVCNQRISNSTNVAAYRLASGDCVIEFKNVGSTVWTVPTSVSSVWALVIGGGGSGGGDEGGGGGAGGYREETITVTSPTISIAVGAGGISTSNDTSAGGNGQNSFFGDLVAIGGGGGGTASNADSASNPASLRNGRAGGSGGGGAGESRSGTAGGTETAGQGNVGGAANAAAGSGGGGAGGVGGNASGKSGGAGGAGKSSWITGTSVLRAGGGGGGCGNTSSATCNSGGAGGSGVGGTGGLGSSGGSEGLPSTGSGGGGAGNSNGLLGFNGGSGIVVIRYNPDTTAPTISNVTSSTTNGAYPVGTIIPITVTFSEVVTVTGTPQLTLETGSTDRTIDFTSGSGTTTLTFNYTVQAGDTSSDLDYVATNSLTLNGGTIRDAAGNNATLTLASPGASGSLGANKALVIDTTAPSLSSQILSANGTSLALSFNETLSSTTAATSAFTVTRGGSETITVSSVAISGSTVTLSLASTIYAGQALTVSYADPSGSDDANALQDLAGNDAPSFTNEVVTNNSTEQASQSIAISSLGTTSKTYPYSQSLSITTSGSLGSGALSYAASDGTASGCSLSDTSSATATVTATSFGTCLITATIDSDITYLSATSSAATFTFIQASQASLSITTLTVAYGQSLTLQTSGGSGSGSITFAYVSGDCSLSGSTLTPTAVGSCLITATQAADSNYLAQTTSNTTITITSGTPTAEISFTSTSFTFGTVNQITVTTSVAGTVRFRANTKVIKTCKATATTLTAPFTATCNYRVSTRRPLTVRAILTPTDAGFTQKTSTSQTFLVGRRTNR